MLFLPAGRRHRLDRVRGRRRQPADLGRDVLGGARQHRRRRRPRHRDRPRGADRRGGKDATPTLSVLKTKSGHELTFDDDGEVVLLANGNGKSSIRFEQDGTVVITAETIKLGASAAEKVVLGDTFMKLFNQHTHPTGVGPSGPPTQPMASSHLSAKVTTE